MRDLLEAFGGLSAYALRWRIRDEQFWMRGLDPLQFVHQRVVGGIVNLGSVEYVIQMLVTAQYGAKALGALGGGGVQVLSVPV